MSTAILEEKTAPPGPAGPPVVNDFSIHVATANGSGSMSSNNILMRSIFQMGIPVSGKNLFPSNIQGLPTWFTIRASREGFIARRRDIAVLICMNPETAHEDVRTAHPGAAVIYEESLKLDSLRSDLHFYPVPFQKLVLELVHDGKLRRRGLAPGDRHGGGRSRRREAVPGQGEGSRDQPERNPRRLRLGREESDQDGPVPARADERDRGQDHRRRERRGGDRLCDGRSDGRDVVSDHA